MKVLNTVRAESTWALDLNGLNRAGRRLAPEFIETIAKRFGFSDIPPYSAETPLRYRNGTFRAEGGEVRIDLKISRTTCSVETPSSTETGDACLELLLETACGFFEVPRAEAGVHARSYVSELNFHAEPDLIVAQDNDAAFLEAAARAMGGAEGSFRLAGFCFSTDPYGGTWPLVIERKIDAPFRSGQWYSRAALPTLAHVSLLEQFEKLILRQ